MKEVLHRLLKTRILGHSQKRGACGFAGGKVHLVAPRAPGEGVSPYPGRGSRSELFQGQRPFQWSIITSRSFSNAQKFSMTSSIRDRCLRRTGIERNRPSLREHRIEKGPLAFTFSPTALIGRRPPALLEPVLRPMGFQNGSHNASGFAELLTQPSPGSLPPACFAASSSSNTR